MRKWLLLLCLIALSLPLLGQRATLFFDNFDTGTLSPSYTIYQMSGSPTVTFTTSTTRSYSASYALYHSFSSVTPYEDDYIVFGPITFTGANALLSFWQNIDYASDYIGHYLYYSTDGTSFDYFDELPLCTEDTWTFASVDISSIAPPGATIWLALNYYGYFANAWWVDNLLVDCDEVTSILAGVCNKTDTADDGGVTVTILGPGLSTVSASPSGDYSMAAPVGTYTVEATCPGYYPHTVTGVTLVDGATTTVNFTLNPRPVGTVTGYADLTDTPGADAGIEVYLDHGGWTTTTDAFGHFVLADTPIGSYVAYAYQAGYYLGSSAPFTLEAGAVVDLDTLFLNPIVIVSSCLNFDDDDGGLIASPSMGAWEWGTPSGTTAPEFSRSTPNCWGTIITGNYASNGVDWSLIVDFDLLGMTGVTEVDFWHWYNTESFDGGLLQYSEDGGTTWSDITPTPAYSGTLPSGWGNPLGGMYAYYGNSGAWVNAVVDLTGTSATHLRFRFGSDSSVSYYPGWYIDDLCMSYVDPVGMPKGDVDGYVYDNNSFLPVAGATVTGPGGRWTTTNSAGYFMLTDCPVGVQSIGAHKTGYFPNHVDVPVNEHVAVTVYIPLDPVQYEPEGTVVVDIAYDYPETVEVITFCNTTGAPIDFTFDPWGSGVPTGIPAADPGGYEPPAEPFSADFARTLAVSNRPEGHSGGLERAMATGDILETLPVYGGVDICFGIGLKGTWNVRNYWVSDIASVGTYIYIRENSYPGGASTGRYFNSMDYTPASSWTADMTWDGEYVWFVDVGGTNNIYAFDPVTMEVVDEISDPDGLWNSVSQRGLAYDFVEDVFFIGGWNTDVLFKIAGKSWPDPGAILGTPLSIPDGIAGLGYHPGRRTVWISCNASPDHFLEVDYDAALLLNNIPSPLGTSYTLSGCEVDGDGVLWFVDQETNSVYRMDTGYGVLPGGLYFEPRYGTLAPGECVTINLITGGHSATPGTYEFPGYLDVDGVVTPITVPMIVNVNPTIDRGWNLIAVPVTAVPDDPWAQLHDDIIPFDCSATGSQLYAWDPIRGLFTIPAGFERTRGYYLWSWHDEIKFDVWGAAYTGNVNKTIVDYPAATYRGWDLIGNPFNVRVDWDAVTSDPGFVNVKPTAWFFSTKYGWATYTPGLPPMGATNEIDPWIGFWVELSGLANGSIMFRENYTYESLYKAPVAKAEAEESLMDDFILRISARSVSGSDIRNDYWNYMATHPLATDGTPLDDLDHVEMSINPPGATVLNASFAEGVNYLKDNFKTTFSAPGVTKTWTMNVRGLTNGTRVTLSWPRSMPLDPADGSMGVLNIPACYDLFVTHPTSGNTINMRTDTSITFTYSAATNVVFTVTSTTLDVEENINLPEVYSMSQNYPNPFNSTTAIMVGLPEDDNVSVEVYNVMGNLVRTLASNATMKAGYHKLLWDGRDSEGQIVSTGVYMYRVVTPNFSETKKMILVK